MGTGKEEAVKRIILEAQRGQYGAMSFLVNFEEYDKRIEVRTTEMLGDR